MYGFSLQSIGCQTYLETFNSAFPCKFDFIQSVHKLKHFEFPAKTDDF